MAVPAQVAQVLQAPPMMQALQATQAAQIPAPYFIANKNRVTLKRLQIS